MIQDFLYLKEKNIKEVLELILESYVVTTFDTDFVLKHNKFGRAHQRLIMLIDNNPGITVSEVLNKLKITKQSLSRTLQDLLSKKIVSQKKGEKDGREKLLFLDDKGNELSKQIFDTQKKRILYAFKNSTPEDVLSFKNVLIKIIK